MAYTATKRKSQPNKVCGKGVLMVLPLINENSDAGSCDGERAGHGVTAGLARRRVARLGTADADGVIASRHCPGPVPSHRRVLAGPELKAELERASCRDELPREALQRPERDR